ncbi:MAG: enoyl-CoA hydratase [Acidobacteria bacterium]|nr:enoyl-CoA hydratase [Acidobacteriota bacterium]MCW5968821.1 enoyl-CoA hydratase [Blastocatellales bacterium]
MDTEHLLIEIGDGVARVTLNRPERRNALSLGLMRELAGVLRGVEAEQDVRAVILAASGSVFSSGHDLNELRGRTAGEYREIFDACVELMATIERIPQPVIAEVQGVATAAGCQLVAACDLAVASEDARFATPGVRIGLFCSTPMVALSRAVGRKRALEMLLTGNFIDAHTAAEWGLVNRVVPKGELKTATTALAAEIASASPLTLGIGKSAFYAQIELDEARAYSYTKEIMSLNAMAEDAQEGIGAFLDKRTPCWRGR